MKKLVLLLIVAFAVSVSAQNILSLSDANLTYKYAGVVSDTATNAAPFTKIVTPNSTFSLWYNMKVKITEATASTATAIALKARMFPTDAWTTLTTIVYYGTGTDTTVAYQQIATKMAWNYYGLVLTPTTGRVKLTTFDAAFRK